MTIQIALGSWRPGADAAATQDILFTPLAMWPVSAITLGPPGVPRISLGSRSLSLPTMKTSAFSQEYASTFVSIPLGGITAPVQRVTSYQLMGHHALVSVVDYMNAPPPFPLPLPPNINKQSRITVNPFHADVNECAMDGHMCEYKCENFGGYHECTCPDGSLQVGDSCAPSIPLLRESTAVI